VDAFGNGIGNTVAGQIKYSGQTSSRLPESTSPTSVDISDIAGILEDDGPLDPMLSDLPNVVLGSNRTYEHVLSERGVPYRRDTDGELHYASIGRDGQFVTKPGDIVLDTKAYRDADGNVVYVHRNFEDGYDLPEGVNAIDVRELYYDGQLRGRDFGPPKTWVDRIRQLGVTAGDPADSLRLQVAVDASHPTLARYIDPGTGQVNPLQWSEFRSAALAEGLPMLVSSNGIGNFYQQARDNIRILAEAKDVLAVNVYNPTIDGNFLPDAIVEAIAANLWGQEQTVQVAIQMQLREAMIYNAALSESLNLHDDRALRTEFVGHSQGTINGNLAIDRMDPIEKRSLIVYNIGTASWHLPKGVYNFINIVDRNDPVTNWTGSRVINEDPYAVAHPTTYRLRETDINEIVGKMNAGNHHSFYLYAQTPQFRQELGVTRQPPGMLTRPF
jgi:hypothetical protein